MRLIFLKFNTMMLGDNNKAIHVSKYIWHHTSLSPIQASLLHPWIICFSLIISAWWNLTSSKLKKSEVTQRESSMKTIKLVWIRLVYGSSIAFSLQKDKIEKINQYVTPVLQQRGKRRRRGSLKPLQHCYC